MRGMWLRAVARSVLGVSLAIGCAQAFGIDEACEVGDSSCEQDLLCEEYCGAVRDNCVDEPQYNEFECENLCPFFPRAADAATASANANTLDCRLARAVSRSAERGEDCRAAGRGGNGECGSNCEAFCSLMKGVCPNEFDSFIMNRTEATPDEACIAACSGLRDRMAFDPDIAGEDHEDLADETPTVQCRLWHLGSAAIDVSRSGRPSASGHCAHAIAMGFCRDPSPPTP
jgi:hypothetical protein